MSAHLISLFFGQEPTKTPKLTLRPKMNVQASDLTQTNQQRTASPLLNKQPGFVSHGSDAEA